ncbi:cytochrome P450 [Baekduia soli]|uniref:Cytochrome P450 n=1 Tax=Baekduia soli TaxID=496014 RepID=A0A5B8U5L6_9ACTN|nr:cytochrome P450 [Baekduia soli]QEC47942.1 cytochrome P450 [Baekduia soli]
MTTLSLDDHLDAVLASDAEAMKDPYPLWRRLREEAPMHWHGPVLLVAPHRTVKAIFRDDEKRVFSNNYSVIGSRQEAVARTLSGEQLEAFHAVGAFEAGFISHADGDQHERLRRIAHRAFTPRRIAELRAAMERYVDAMLGTMATDEVVDLMPFAYRLPLMVISDLLGIPEADRELIRDWSAKIGRNRNGTQPGPLMEAHAAIGEFKDYLAGVIAHHRRHPDTTDLVAALVDANQTERLSDDEMTSVFVNLLFAGHETTTSLIAIGLHELLDHRPQWERLCADPGLVGGAVEELLRWVSPAQWQNRVALEDRVYDGFRIPAGTTLMLLNSAANRDPEVFAEPETLDIARTDSRQHLALGFGPHFCLGAALTRMEGAVALGELARRFPAVQQAGGELAWAGNAMFRRPAALPVVLGPPAPPRG